MRRPTTHRGKEAEDAVKFCVFRMCAAIHDSLLLLCVLNYVWYSWARGIGEDTSPGLVGKPQHPIGPLWREEDSWSERCSVTTYWQYSCFCRS